MIETLQPDPSGQVETTKPMQAGPGDQEQSYFTEVDYVVTIKEAENQITLLARLPELALDICDQRFLCRMAKKLGCRVCAKNE